VPTSPIRAPDLPGSARARRFEGVEHGADVSFFVIDYPAGGEVELHRHPYQEVFVVHAGRARFQAGEHTLEATAGDIVIVPAGAPHAFANVGDAPLRMTGIHVAAAMQTEWIESDESSGP
jgi:quercetin dioxygenase-like cupin family protein